MSGHIDSHQHFWSVSDGKALWPTPAEGKIYRDYFPADLAPHLSSTGVAGTVLVQVDPTEEDTRELLGLAHATDFVLGVVGWVDFEAADACERITKLAQDPLIVGLRPMLHNIPDTQWILRPEFTPVIETMIGHDLSFDALIRPQHLPIIHDLCTRHPELRVVVDHGAKPRIRERGFGDWAESIRTVANETAARCKISGLVTEADCADPMLLKQYVDHLIQCFGPERLLWGSDWPVCEAVCTYDAWYGVARELLQTLSSSDCDAVFGDVARDFYRLKRTSPAHTLSSIA
jgi:L-fuconolactonase